MLIITDEYDTFNKCTNNQTEDKVIFINFVLFSTPGNILILSLIGLVKKQWLELQKLVKDNWEISIPNSLSSLNNKRT